MGVGVMVVGMFSSMSVVFDVVERFVRYVVWVLLL